MGPIKKPLKIGLIGGGVTSSIGWSHISAAQLDGVFKVEAGCFSRQPENSFKTAERWNIDKNRVYRSIDELVEKESRALDAVIILTPTPNHLHDFSKVINADIPIICEKPLAQSTKEAKIMLDMVKKVDGFAAVTFNYSGYPMIRELREIIADGELGDLINIKMEMPQEFFLKIDPISKKTNKPRGWRLKDEYIPTICLDLGVHLHHLSYFLTGLTIKKVNAVMSKSSIHPQITDDVNMWLQFENNVRGDFWFSKSAIGHRNGLRINIYGTKGSAEWIQENSEFLSIALNTGERKIIERGCATKVAQESRYNRFRSGHPSGFIEAFSNVYQDIGKSIVSFKEKSENKENYVFGVDHSIEGLLLFEKAVESNKSGTWVRL